MRKSIPTEQASAVNRLYYRPREVAELTGLGLRTIYADVYAGIIPSRKIGDARLIPASWLLAQTDEQAQEIRQALAHTPRRKTTKNRYSLRCRARALRAARTSCERTISHFLRASFGEQIVLI